MKKFSRFAIPYLVWMILLVVVPLILMTFLALSENGQSIKLENWSFGVSHFKTVFSGEYIRAFFKSIELASISTVGCIALGYPLAYILVKSKIRNKLEDMYYDLKINLFDKFDDLSSKLSSIKTHNKQNGHLIDLYYEQLNSTLEKEKKLNSDSFFKINHLNQKKKLNHKNIIKQIKKKEQFCNKIDDCNDCIENVSCGWSTVMNKCVETNYSEDSIGVKFNKITVHMFSYNKNICK